MDNCFFVKWKTHFGNKMPSFLPFARVLWNACALSSCPCPGPCRRRPFGLRRPCSRRVPTGKSGLPKTLSFNVFNLREQSSGCFDETKKHLRKIIRQVEKTTRHLEKIIRPAVDPSPGLVFGRSGQKETEEAPVWRGVLGLANANIQHFWAKSKSAQLRFNISPAATSCFDNCCCPLKVWSDKGRWITVKSLCPVSSLCQSERIKP